jgi:homogentisate 1,2-dioxygenase
MRPTRSDPAYTLNADGDELLFIRRGQGILRSTLGDLPFAPLDYVYIPKGIIYRLELALDEEHDYLSIECKHSVGVPERWRNETGQLRMDAPYCHRDFRRPEFRGQLDEGLREVVIKRNDMHHHYL